MGRAAPRNVRLAALLLIAEGPQQLPGDRELSVRTNGVWRPARRGLPALAQLGDEGLIRATETDGLQAFTTDRRRPAGAVGEGPGHPSPWETATADASGRSVGARRADVGEPSGRTAMAARAVTAARDPAALADAARVLERRPPVALSDPRRPDPGTPRCRTRFGHRAGGAEDAQDD